MRKSLLFLCVVFAVMVHAQQKVAILEPLDGEDSEVTSMEKAMIRGELRKAIAKLDGFEPITRTDIDRLLTEQDFQNKGYVSENEIHHIGQMSGADYLCVSTINKSDLQFYLEAYLVDVNTGDILNPASQFGSVENGNISGLYQICRNLVREMVADIQGVDSTPIVETFDPSSWQWTIFTHNGKSALIANGQLRLTNYEKTGITQSNVSLPIELNKNFRIAFNFEINKAELFSSVGVKFAGNNSVTVNSGTTSFKVGSRSAVVKKAQIGLGRNKPVLIELVKQGDNVAVIVNGVEVCNEVCSFATNQIAVFAGINTLAMLNDAVKKAAELAKVEDEYYTSVYPDKRDWMDNLFPKDDKGTYLDAELRTLLGDTYEPFIEMRRDQQRNKLQARFPYSARMR